MSKINSDNHLNNSPQAGYPDGFAEILEKARLGDNYAAEVIFDKYKGLVRAKSRSYFLIGADTEDLIQEGMLGLYKAIRDYRPEKHASFSAFADMCVTRQIITAIKAATRKKHSPLNSYISLSAQTADNDDGDTANRLQIVTSVIDPEEMLIDRERSVSFRNELKILLSGLEISVLSLYLQGAPYAEISERLKKSEKSVDNAFQRAKRKLEKYLAMEKD